jgi:hypothetical protein
LVLKAKLIETGEILWVSMSKGEATDVLSRVLVGQWGGMFFPLAYAAAADLAPHGCEWEEHLMNVMKVDNASINAVNSGMY